MTPSSRMVLSSSAALLFLLVPQFQFLASVVPLFSTPVIADSSSARMIAKQQGPSDASRLQPWEDLVSSSSVRIYSARCLQGGEGGEIIVFLLS